MRESSPSQAELYERSVNIGRRLLLSRGEERFGKPSEAIRRAIMSIRILERLRWLIPLVADTNIQDWEGLLRVSDSREIDGYPPGASTPRSEAEAKAAERAYILDSTTYLLMRDQDANTSAYPSLKGASNSRRWSYDQAHLIQSPELERRICYEVGRKLGAVVGAKRMLFLQGIKRFGEPDAATIAAIEAIKDSGPLEALGERIVNPGIQTWAELLRTP